MKKVFILLMSIMMVFAFISCDDASDHVHSFDTVEYDETNHWNVCSCGEKDGVEEHKFELNFADGKNVCSVCGYTADAVDARIWDGTTADTTWYNAEASEFSIKTASEFAGLAKLVNEGTTFKDKTVKLDVDLDLNGKNWTPIGPIADEQNKFQGTFDGQDHTIYNLTVKQEAAYKAAGLFGALNGTVQNLVIDNASIESISKGNVEGATSNGNAVVAGTIYDSGLIDKVTVKNSRVSANRYVSAIAGYVYGNVTNCTVENVELIATPDNLTGEYDNGDKVGGIIGYLGEGTYTITGNEVSNITLVGYRDIGGIVGYANTETTVSNNTVSGVTIKYDDTHNYKNYETKEQHDLSGTIGEDHSKINTGNTVENVVISKLN